MPNGAIAGLQHTKYIKEITIMQAMSLEPLDIVCKVVDHLNNQADGTVTVSNKDGTIVSVQPDGSVQSLPAGTNGAYERARVMGDKLVYSPSNSRAFIFAYISELPN